MGPDLLERQKELRTLASLVERAVSGRGSTALVVGDAGIGKTSLVRELLASLPRDVRVLAAGCEDLLTPRALGPLRDAVRSSSGPLTRALAEGAGAEAVLGAVLDELISAPAPTVLVIDDAHWADGGTAAAIRTTTDVPNDNEPLAPSTHRGGERRRLLVFGSRSECRSVRQRRRHRVQEVADKLRDVADADGAVAVEVVGSQVGRIRRRSQERADLSRSRRC